MDNINHTPKIRPSFRSSKSRRSLQSNNRYKSPLSTNSSFVSAEEPPSKRQCTETKPDGHSKRQCHSSTETKHDGHSKSSNTTPESKPFKRIHSPYRSPLTNTKDRNEEVQTGSECVESMRNLVKKLFVQHKNLEEEIEDLRNKGYHAEQLVWYIDKLHEYNDIKDTAQTIMGRIAVLESTSVKDIHESFGLSSED